MTDSDGHNTGPVQDGQTSESLISMGRTQGDGQYGRDELGGQGDPRMVAHKGERFQVPDNLWDPALNDGVGGINGAAAVKMAMDLRKQISDKAAHGGEVPNAYTLTVPEKLDGELEASTEHPLFAPVSEWAKAKGLSQSDFDELTEVFYTYEAARQGRRDEDQIGMLTEALGDDAERNLADLGRWVDGLLGEDIAQRTGIADTLESIASSANGVLFLKALKDRIGVMGVPTNRAGGAGAAAVSRGSLQALQGSQAYRDAGHPDHAETVRRVRDGFRSLYGD